VLFLMLVGSLLMLFELNLYILQCIRWYRRVQKDTRGSKSLKLYENIIVYL